MPLFRTGAAAFVVVSTADAKEHLAVLHSDHDTLIAALVGYATEVVENMTSMALVQRSLRLTLDAFPSDWIVLLRPPVQSITNVTYFDGDNSQQTWSTSEWESDLYADSPWVPSYMNTRIRPTSGVSWPTTYERMGAVQVNYVAGFQSAATVPGPLISAVKLIVADLYENREETVMGPAPQTLGAVQKLTSSYRNWFEDAR